MMIRAKNYKTVTKFVKVMPRPLWPLFSRTRCSHVLPEKQRMTTQFDPQLYEACYMKITLITDNVYKQIPKVKVSQRPKQLFHILWRMRSLLQMCGSEVV